MNMEYIIILDDDNKLFYYNHNIKVVNGDMEVDIIATENRKLAKRFNDNNIAKSLIRLLDVGKVASFYKSA